MSTTLDNVFRASGLTPEEFELWRTLRESCEYAERRGDVRDALIFKTLAAIWSRVARNREGPV